ncbi:MFS transporter [Streptomyces silvisoli]|uniref:MFS transporter n=1 Tax=Streptomyces silvisoli TaxID=3034235 RepID=A0ABT5ZSR6_9ACTN|nr:MFS transporter [Streptomyces silvisoli]MDF3292865.1 MFS transporter [Streptomyces silvisoli]
MAFVGALRRFTAGPMRRVGRAVAHGTARLGGGVRSAVRRVTHAQGAGETGLAKLLELQAVSSAGDMMITIALASTVFFSVPAGEARGRVALYLLVTMAPFTLLAPVIGPLLDSIPHGRRAAMAGSMLARAVLAWAMASVVSTAGLGLYPAALGVLVASKANGVVRSAVVPRLLPPRISLVKANSRMTLSGLLATALAAPFGALLHLIGPAWPLYGAFAIFSAGAFWCFSLPPHVDSAKGERKASLHREDTPTGKTVRRPGLRTVGVSVLYALQANCALRGLSGLLTFFLAFVLREHPPGGLSPAVALGLVAVAAGGGNALGNVLGAWLRTRAPEVIITTVLLVALGVLVFAAIGYGVVAVALAAATTGLTQALGKLSLDALIQRDVPEEVRTSAFARSETVLQLAWVLGGGLGIVLPLNGVLGLAVGAGLLGVAAAATVRGLLAAARRGTPHPRAA